MNYYPNPNYFMPNPQQPMFNQQMPVQQPQQQSIPQSMPVQNNGIIPVRGESVARNYPVALGNSVTFRDETAPYIYTKTMGFSQMDVPRFDKYRLVKEDDAEPISSAENSIDLSVYMLKTDVEPIKSEIEKLKQELEKVNEFMSRRNRKEASDE